MEQILCEDKIYTKSWGKHKNGIQMIIYNSGAYATYKRFSNGVLQCETTIEVKCKDGSYDDGKYALENGYTFVM